MGNLEHIRSVEQAVRACDLCTQPAVVEFSGAGLGDWWLCSTHAKPERWAIADHVRWVPCTDERQPRAS